MNKRTLGKWKELKFKEFITFQRGYDLPVTDMKHGPFPVLGSTSIVGYHDSYKSDPPGVTTGRSGSLGTVLYTDVKFWPHNTALWVRNFKGNNPRFVYYFLKTFPLSQFNSGAGVPTLNRNHLNEYKINIPEKDIQDNIAAILSLFDKLIQKNQKRIDILEEIAQLLYREWFVEFRFHGYEKVKFVDSVQGKIPEGWKIVNLSNFCTLRVGLSYEADHLSDVGIPIATMGIVSTINRFNYDQLKFYDIDTDPKYYLNPGNIVICTHDVTQDRVIIGHPAIIPKDISDKIILGANLFGVFPIDDDVFSYVYHSLRSKLFRDRMKSYAKGTNILFINRKDVLEYKLFNPGDELLLAFKSIIKPIDDLIENLTLANRNLVQTRDLLLLRLMSSDIDVSKLDIKGVEN